MAKVTLRKLHGKVIAHEAVEGSLYAENIRGGCTLIETVYEVESGDDPAKIAMVLRNAHNVCIVGNTVRNGVEQQNLFILNGTPFDPAAR
jgi:hypothetical protein